MVFTLRNRVSDSTRAFVWYDEKMYSTAKQWIVGVDEVGRGPLAGPVYICAIAIPLDRYGKMHWEGLTDSKLMTARARERWHDEAKRHRAKGGIKIAIAYRNAQAIDTHGLSACIGSCVSVVVRRLKLDPSVCTILLDGGLHAPRRYRAQQTIIGGDKIHPIISLAAVVAKVTRDAHMRRLHKKYPQYRWFENKGYGTRMHMETVREIGLSPIHRKSFCRKFTG